MKTFEEFRFRIKHSSISKALNITDCKEFVKKLKELHVNSETNLCSYYNGKYHFFYVSDFNDYDEMRIGPYINVKNDKDTYDTLEDYAKVNKNFGWSIENIIYKISSYNKNNCKFFAKNTDHISYDTEYTPVSIYDISFENGMVVIKFEDL